MGAKDGRAAPFQQGRFSNAPRQPLYSRFRSQGIARNLDEDLRGDVRRPPPHLSPNQLRSETPTAEARAVNVTMSRNSPIRADPAVDGRGILPTNQCVLSLREIAYDAAVQ